MAVVFIAAIALLTYAALTIAHTDRAQKIDCGPEGKPVLNGTACIDRDPYVYP